ncbi:MAG: Gfo/Idh/MocA family oxidoreductase [Alistipes sp.]|nr:Gfo/Idh/MocA family oxidoreductase [Alistipes sp.]
MRKNLLALVCLVALVGTALFSGCCCNDGKPYKIVDNTIVFDEPARAEGQQSMLGFAAEPMPVVRIGFVGLGMRGPGAIKRFVNIEGAEIAALCDLLPENVEKSQALLESLGRARVAEEATYSGEEGWKELCQREDIDLVYLVTPWDLHTPMAVYAMECGKHVAVEVPAAMTVAECWQLVDTSERTRRHCMMLENCIYDHFELTTLNMAQQGLFGEIMHVEGAYIHNLDRFWKEYQGNWRLIYNQAHRGDVYATHGLGPVCQLLNIHRGDRMTRLVSMDTKSVCGLELAKESLGVDSFANGDHTCTLIATEKGKTISLQHNVVTPRPYNRLYQLSGTKGFANKYPVKGFLFAEANEASGNPDHENLSAHEFVPDQVRDALLEKYRHPIQVELMERAKKVGGHGGMDFIMDSRLIYCLQNGLPLDQDVYDAAEWSCIGELSAASIENGSMPVAVPDFTRGDWDKVDGYRHAMK